jgi:protein TonB
MRSTPVHAFALMLASSLLIVSPGGVRSAAAEPTPEPYLWATPPSQEPEDLGGMLAWNPPETAQETTLPEELSVSLDEFSEELPEPLTQVIPEYPALAREAEVGGLVVAQVLVGKDGHVVDAHVDREHSVTMLDDATIEAVRQWVFAPARANHTPVAVWVSVPFNYRLR